LSVLQCRIDIQSEVPEDVGEPGSTLKIEVHA